MSRILSKPSGRQLAVVAGWCLLALFAAPLIADDEEPDPPSLDSELGTEPKDFSRWGPISVAAKFGSFEIDLLARLYQRGFYTEIHYGESDLDLPSGSNIDVSYWSVGLRGYPLVLHEVSGFDFAFYGGIALGVYDLDSSLAPLTGSKSGYSWRAGLEIRYSELPQLGVELQWASHEIDLPGPDLDFDGFLVGVRVHFGIKK